MVAAYLVGTRGTARDAVALGAIVTVTHTIGVFALGLVTLALSAYVLPEQLYPWLNLASGLLVLLVGVAVLRGRVRGARAGAHARPPSSRPPPRPRPPRPRPPPRSPPAALLLAARAARDGRLGGPDPLPLRAGRPARRDRPGSGGAGPHAHRRLQRGPRRDADDPGPGRGVGRRPRRPPAPSAARPDRGHRSSRRSPPRSSSSSARCSPRRRCRTSCSGVRPAAAAPPAPACPRRAGW